MNKHIVIRPLSLCNWNCIYCLPLLKRESYNEAINENKTLEYFDFLFSEYPKNFYHVSGGEPGLLSKEFFDNLSKLKKKHNIKFLSIETNGTIFRHDIDYSFFNQIKYHIFPEISEKSKIEYNDLNPEYNMKYIIVVDGFKFKNLQIILDKYKKLFNAKNHKLELKPDLVFLDNSKYIAKFLLFLKNNQDKNLQFKSIYHRVKISPEEYQICCSNPNSLDISISMDYFTNCCLLSTFENSHIKLSKENLKQYIENYYCIYHDFCKTCKSLRCANKHKNDIFDNFLLTLPSIETEEKYELFPD